MGKILSPEQARATYDLKKGPTNDISEFEVALEQEGIGVVEIPFSQSDFDAFREGFIVCKNECPEALLETAGRFDERRGSEYGYTRKELEIDLVTGKQKEDPKHITHFYNGVYNLWQERFARGPKPLRDFLAMGMELEDAFVGVALQTAKVLDAGGHPNLLQAYAPEGRTRAFMRYVHYDSYEPFDEEGNLIPMNADVAKRHYDIGGITFQGPTSASGFQANKQGLFGHDDAWQDYDSVSGEAQVLFGRTHNKVFPFDDPLGHRVRRLIPKDKEVALEDGRLVMSQAGTLLVPERSALILFFDMPDVDAKISKQETLGLVALNGEHLRSETVT